MANDDKKSFMEKAQAAASSPARKKKGRFSFASIARWFREMKSELKKVVWPTPKQTFNNTLIALSVMFVSAIVVYGFDSLAQLAVSTLITLVK